MRFHWLRIISRRSSRTMLRCKKFSRTPPRATMGLPWSLRFLAGRPTNSAIVRRWREENLHF
jgi:hypothetical protein